MGAVKRYDGKTGAIDSLGRIEADHSIGEYGLVGIAARNDFPAEPWLYFYYSAVEPDGVLTFRLSRIRLSADLARLDMATEKVLIRIRRDKVIWHTGGDLQFDDYGDLWAAVGDNEQTLQGPANTADLRGGILRIHPDDSPKGYSIPAGNFGSWFAARFTDLGKPDTAALFADTAKVKPEIYVKGTRNAYTIALDPVRRWLAWGDVGPDQNRNSEEYNLVKEPAFAGWPYYAGEESMAGIDFYGEEIPSRSTRAAPINTHPKAGLRQLPPVREPLFVRPEGCAMTGPIFRYDGSDRGSGRFPPQFDRKWLISGCDDYGFRLMTLDSAGERIIAQQGIFNAIRTKQLVDLKQGPDGGLYYVDWAKGLFRIEYTGSCQDGEFHRERTGCADPEAANYEPGLPKAFHDPRLCRGGSALAPPPPRAAWFALGSGSLSVTSAGPHRAEFLDLRGRTVAAYAADGPAAHPLSALPGAGLYRLRIRSSQGRAEASFPWLGR
jgi:cytochrome c